MTSDVGDPPALEAVTSPDADDVGPQGERLTRRAHRGVNCACSGRCRCDGYRRNGAAAVDDRSTDLDGDFDGDLKLERIRAAWHCKRRRGDGGIALR
jgi:hypothetical protein